MKLQDIIAEEQLDEINLKQALASLIIGVSTFSTIGHEPTQANIVAAAKIVDKEDSRVQKLANIIVGKYTKVNPEVAMEIAKLAIKHEQDEFPKAQDILSVIGIESEFNSEAKSKLRFDKAVGLMQVRPGIWKLDKEKLRSIENQVEEGVKILTQYYEKLKDKTKALHAYNLGITDVRRGKENPHYIEKFNKERDLYSEI